MLLDLIFNNILISFFSSKKSHLRATELFVAYPQGISQDAEDGNSWSSEDANGPNQIGTLSEFTQVRYFSLHCLLLLVFLFLVKMVRKCVIEEGDWCRQDNDLQLCILLDDDTRKTDQSVTLWIEPTTFWA